jgi:hypothetical protein
MASQVNPLTRATIRRSAVPEDAHEVFIDDLLHEDR